MAPKYKRTFDNKIAMNSSNFQKILDFYLFRCPVEGTSFRGVSFSEHGWRGTKQFAKLKKLLLSASSTDLASNYYPCKKEELSGKFDKVSSISPVNEYCVFLKNEENTVMQSLFSAIRNAFAHGSFSVREYTSDGGKTKVYFIVNYKAYLKAEIVLQESTLLRWMKIVEDGYSG